MFKVFIALFFITNISLGQFINNPSFEGEPQASTPPPDWHSCNAYSTPDTQPGSWNVSNSASEGQSFISLVTRGVSGERNDNMTEAIGSQLRFSFSKGATYRFSIDLAHSVDFDDFFRFTVWDPVILKIYFGNNECEKDILIWTSPVISNSEWITYQFDYVPDKSYAYIILDAVYSNSTAYFGNILVDNLKVNDRDNPIENKLLTMSSGCKLGIPNVFTPNSDGRNENFVIQYNSNVSRFDLKVYNRWGKLVFESNNIDTVWDGRNENGSEADSGVYFWTATCFCIEGNSINDDNLKGTVTLIR